MLVKHREWITVEKVIAKGCNKCGKRLGDPSIWKEAGEWEGEKKW